MTQRDILPPVGTMYGSPFGRRKVADNPQAADVRIFRVTLFDGDYDVGGAYWGGPPSLPLWACVGTGLRVFYRARGVVEARRTFTAEFPDAVVFSTLPVPAE